MDGLWHVHGVVPALYEECLYGACLYVHCTNLGERCGAASFNIRVSSLWRKRRELLVCLRLAVALPSGLARSLEERDQQPERHAAQRRQQPAPLPRRLPLGRFELRHRSRRVLLPLVARQRRRNTCANTSRVSAHVSAVQSREECRAPSPLGGSGSASSASESRFGLRLVYR